MSRPNQQRIRVPPTPDNPYQGTTSSTLPLTHSYHHNKNEKSTTNYHLKCTGSIRGAPCPLEHDDTFTDDLFTIDHSYYDFYDQDHGYQTSPNKLKETATTTSRTDFSYSSDSGSTRIPCYEYEEIASNHRYSHIERASSYRKSQQFKDARRVYPNDIVERCAVEISLPNNTTLNNKLPRRAGHLSRLSNCSYAEEAPNALIHGCGGKCQTFENVCYYFLQVAFTMGILIGISLGIAGWVLRKSPARNLQVLLYIGAMLSLVCALLLGIQCNARKTARIKQRIWKSRKRIHIPLDLLPPRNGIQQQQQPLVDGNLHRGVPITLVQMSSRAAPAVLQVQRSYDHNEHMVEQPGIPWWRRKDLQ